VSLPRLIAMQCGHGCQNHFISQLRSLSQLLSLRAQFLHNRVHFFGFILCRGDDMSRFGIFIFFADITILPKRILISKPRVAALSSAVSISNLKQSSLSPRRKDSCRYTRTFGNRGSFFPTQYPQVAKISRIACNLQNEQEERPRRSGWILLIFWILR
jgi:hypothetical protein